MKFKPGDKVEIISEDIFYPKHRKNVRGEVISVSGGLICVRPSWCTWVIELYENELRHV